MEYEPVAESEPLEASSSSNRRPPPASSDGVFSNLSAKPAKQPEVSSPPPYETVDAPPYVATFHAPLQSSATVAEDGDILVDGLEVGSVFVLVVNCIVSVAFDFIGKLVLLYLSRLPAYKHTCLEPCS